MKIKEIENAVIKFCNAKNILIVRGQIPEDKLEEVRQYLVILKRQFKNKKAFERKEPKLIKEIRIL